jgi:signal transduction histidine kinase
MMCSEPPCSPPMLEPSVESHSVGLMILGLSHDLRQPLTAAKGWVQYLDRYLSRDGEQDEEIGRVIAAIDGAITQLQVRLDETLAHTYLTPDDSLPIHRYPTNLVELVQGVASEARLATDQHAITVRAASSALVGQWDRFQLGRVFANLLNNAVKYSLDGGEILVTMDAEPAYSSDGASGQMAVVRVYDRGIGIHPTDLPCIFEPFYRGKNVVDRISGSGIGLSTVRQIVVLHHGEVSVESRPGGGVIFTIRLPLGCEGQESGT